MHMTGMGITASEAVLGVSTHQWTVGAWLLVWHASVVQRNRPDHHGLSDLPGTKWNA